jgi:hypothetical protein
VGSVTEDNALLLAADGSTRLRFVPNEDYNGTVDPAITFRAWDQTTGTNGGTADTTENGGTTAFSTATVTASILVNPVNDYPQAEDDEFSVDEDAENGTVVGTVQASDPDKGQSLTYEIIAGNDDGVFAIDAQTGEITVADNSNLDFETTPSYTLTIKITDDGDPAKDTTVTITITVNDVNE